MAGNLSWPHLKRKGLLPAFCRLDTPRPRRHPALVGARQSCRFIPILLLTLLCLLPAAGQAPATAAVPSEAPAPQVNPDLPASSRSYPEQPEALHLLREDLRLLRDQLEQARKDAASEREADRLASRLRELESVMAVRAAKDADAVHAYNRTALVIAAALLAGGFTVMVLVAWLQWRAVGKLAASLPVRLAESPSADPPHQLTFTPSAAAERSNTRLSTALLLLEERLADLERSTRLNVGEAPLIIRQHKPPTVHPPEKHNGAATPGRNGGDQTLEILLARGQAFLNAERHDEAILTFEQILTAHPAHVEALVKRGIALERAGRTNEAISSYDQAIAADPSFTAAYLHKGGLFNRLERYGEALDCYEKALRLKERRPGS